jgi:hypothetical protein
LQLIFLDWHKADRLDPPALFGWPSQSKKRKEIKVGPTFIPPGNSNSLFIRSPYLIVQLGGFAFADEIPAS